MDNDVTPAPTSEKTRGGAYVRKASVGLILNGTRTRRFRAMILAFPKCFAHSSSGHSDDDSDSTREEQRQTEETGERERETERV